MFLIEDLAKGGVFSFIVCLSSLLNTRQFGHVKYLHTRVRCAAPGRHQQRTQTQRLGTGHIAFGAIANEKNAVRRAVGKVGQGFLKQLRRRFDKAMVRREYQRIEKVMNATLPEQANEKGFF